MHFLGILHRFLPHLVVVHDHELLRPNFHGLPANCAQLPLSYQPQDPHLVVVHNHELLCREVLQPPFKLVHVKATPAQHDEGARGGA